MTFESSHDDPMEALADEFLARLRHGESASISDYCAQYPDMAEEIRDLFPALMMMEDLKPGSESGSDGARGLPPTLEKIADYRIIGEIGRGGNGSRL